jgi:hypothetical protein
VTKHIVLAAILVFSAFSVPAKADQTPPNNNNNNNNNNQNNGQGPSTPTKPPGRR